MRTDHLDFPAVATSSMLLTIWCRRSVPWMTPSMAWLSRELLWMAARAFDHAHIAFDHSQRGAQLMSRHLDEVAFVFVEFFRVLWALLSSFTRCSTMRSII